MINVLAYTVYLLLTVLVVGVVGKILFRNGRFYLVEIFGQETIADSVNRILFVGYFLVNAGGAFNCLVDAASFSTYTAALEYVFENQGKLLLLLGIMHAFNLAALPLLKRVFKKKFHLPDNSSIHSNHH